MLERYNSRLHGKPLLGLILVAIGLAALSRTRNSEFEIRNSKLDAARSPISGRQRASSTAARSPQLPAPAIHRFFSLVPTIGCSTANHRKCEIPNPQAPTLRFEANEGQTDPRVRFLSRGLGYTLFLTGNEALLTLQKGRTETEYPNRVRPQAESVLDMTFVSANPTPQVLGLNELAGRSNYFIGNDPKKWLRGIRSYARVRYQGVYPGVDLVFYGTQGKLEYDFVVAPGADPGAIRLSFLGAGLAPTRDGRPQGAPLRIDPHGGDLIVGLSGGEVRFHKPLVYQLIGAGLARPNGGAIGARLGVPGNASEHFLEGRYVLRVSKLEIGNSKFQISDSKIQNPGSKIEVGFEVTGYDPRKPLIIDPVLSYSTYLGGDDRDVGNGIAVDSDGSVYVTGETNSTNFPSANPFQPAIAGLSDVFVTKLDPTGSQLVYSTYLGGTGGDRGTSIAVDASGNAYVTGRTNSPDFPTTPNAFADQLFGDFDAIVVKLSADGSSLLYSSYLGGDGNDAGFGIAVDALGDAYVTGGTNSDDFPITGNAFQSSFGGGLNDAFVTKLDPTQAGTDSLVYSTYLGGSDMERGNSITVDASGNAYVTGRTSSVDFPLMNPFQGTCGGCPSSFDAFVAVLDPTGSTLVYSTYFGGTGNDQGFGIAVDSAGNAYVAGETASTDFYTLNPFQASLGGTVNAFVASFDPTGTPLYSSYLGGTSSDSASGIALDTQGNVYVTGRTSSPDFPTANAFQDTYGGGVLDAFVAKIDSSPSLIYSSFLGGSGDENAPSTGPSGNPSGAIAVDSAGNAYVTGMTSSLTDFPTVNTLQPYGGHPSDAFVAKISATDYLDAQQAAEKCLKPFLAHRNVTPGRGPRKSRSASPGGGCMETRSAHCCRLSRP